MIRTWYIETFGCQMNRSDSQLMAHDMEQAGFIQAERAEEADIVIYNTCSVRQNAEDRVLGRIKSLPQRKGRIIVAAGCMAQRRGHELLDENIVNMAVGPYQEPAMGSLVTQYISQKEKALFTSQEREDFLPRLNPGVTKDLDQAPWHRWVTITHGCENYCSYCIVPFVRGKLISFSSNEILDYIRVLPGEGVREITLLGQNVNQYGQDNHEIPFWKLLEHAAQVDGLERISFLTSHPKDFSPDIARVIRDNENISRSIHLPVQSGSSAVLKKMNRKYTRESYLETVATIRSLVPDISLTTDIIMGFPGETEQDYHQTLDLVKQTGFEDAYMYMYSPREGTPAWHLKETLTRDQKVARLNELIAVQRERAAASLRQRIGSRDRCIVEKISKRSPGEVMGRTFHNHTVVLPGTDRDISRTIPITITDINGATLLAQPTG